MNHSRDPFFGAVLLIFVVSLGLAKAAEKTETPGPSEIKSKQEALFAKLKVREAWRYTKGSPDLLIGVIDNGFDFFHPALKNQLIPGFYATGGYHTEVYTNIAHGTIVSGIIAARPTVLGDVSGLAPGCKILTASTGAIEHEFLAFQRKFKKEHPDADAEVMHEEMKRQAPKLKERGDRWVAFNAVAMAESIHFLVDHGVRVINLSAFIQKSLVSSQDVWARLDGALSYAAEKDVVIVLGQDSISSPGFSSENPPSQLSSSIWIHQPASQAWPLLEAEGPRQIVSEAQGNRRLRYLQQGRNTSQELFQKPEMQIFRSHPM